VGDEQHSLFHVGRTRRRSCYCETQALAFFIGFEFSGSQQNKRFPDLCRVQTINCFYEATRRQATFAKVPETVTCEATNGPERPGYMGSRGVVMSHLRVQVVFTRRFDGNIDVYPIV
jgi:hypothetical protein